MLLSPWQQPQLLGSSCHPRSGVSGADGRTAASPDPFAMLIGRGLPWSAPRYQGRAWDFHRSVWSAIVPRRSHHSPGRAAATNRSVCRGKFPLEPQCFSRLGSLAYRPGRNVAPPELSLPGPFVIRDRTLAAYLSARRVRARISARARPRAGRIRSIGVGSIAPFRTEPSTPAAHAEPEA
jgi:hypothetical protein